MTDGAQPSLSRTIAVACIFGIIGGITGVALEKTVLEGVSPVVIAIAVAIPAGLVENRFARRGRRAEVNATKRNRDSASPS